MGEEGRKISPKVKEVLVLLGGGIFIAAALVFPAVPLVVKDLIALSKEEKRKKQSKEWERFNLWRLRAVLKRLHKQKMVEVAEKDGEVVVVLTEKGRVKYLKNKLEEMIIEKPKNWDGKWRLVIYDIAGYKRSVQCTFRETLKRLRFLRLQKSVYLYPYQCEDEIEILRQFYGIVEEVTVLTVGKLENEEVYKRYFGL